MTDTTGDESTEVLEGQPCPMCLTKNLTLTEAAREIPFFGTCYIFSMDCQNCDYHIADIEGDGDRPPVKYTLVVESEEDLKIRVIKSSKAIIKIPRVLDITPGPFSNGYITNVEGIINRAKKTIDDQKNDDDKAVRKKAKSLSKKLQNVLWGRDKLKLILIDKTGNSAIISEKAVKSKP